MNTEGWAPCSDRSIERDDPLAGTAGFGERWMLVEIDGAWGQHAFLQSPLDPAIGRALVRRVERAGMRPLAIRRTGRRVDGRRNQQHWRWAIVDARAGAESVRWGVVDDPADLLDVPLDGSTGEPSSEPIVCVCTHARHDQCCAVRGRPVVTQLARTHPAETWECSHLGGDRFAATMIVFPHGLLYGRMTAADAPGILDAHARGEVAPGWLRGRTSLSTQVQAAEAFARADTGDDRIDAFRVIDERVTDAGWTVDLDHGGAAIAVDLVAEHSEPLLSTCAAVHAAPVRQFVLAGIR